MHLTGLMTFHAHTSFRQDIYAIQVRKGKYIAATHFLLRLVVIARLQLEYSKFVALFNYMFIILFFLTETITDIYGNGPP